MTPALLEEGFIRELIRFIQSARKKAGLEVDDRIKLSLSIKIDSKWAEVVKSEVLATELKQNENYSYDEIIKINDKNITISLEKD